MGRGEKGKKGEGKRWEGPPAKKLTNPPLPVMYANTEKYGNKHDYEQ